MKPVYFSNKKSLEIISSSIRNDIKSSISKIGSFNLMSKYYTFLNKKNVNNLKENNFLVSLSTFGKKFILFVTTYNAKKYCIFINKKNESMNITQLKFSDEIFEGTLFDGELMKNDKEQWIFLINDIAYYKGENIITKSFYDRQKIIDEILQNDYQNESDEPKGFYISKKNYFKYEYIKDLVENYMNKLSYKCAGLYFKNLNNFSDNYLFIFPECRSDSKILNNGITIDEQKVVMNNYLSISEKVIVKSNEVFHKIHKPSEDQKDEDTEDEDLFENIEKINLPNAVITKEKITPSIHRNLPKLDKTNARFIIHKTGLPDIYELYCKNNNNNIEKYSYASVPDIDTSNFIKSLFLCRYDNNEDINNKIKNNNAIYVECNYHKGFKKWVPYKKVDSTDTLNVINQIQTILDSL
jgi:hypothetical protein